MTSSPARVALLGTESFREMSAAAAATPGSLPPPAGIARVMGRYGQVPVPASR
ncbi:MAG TPA: hypothetical protein VFF73_37885 [Planctomycetota bacterium]|nr:hypothetical protein [Planctomycetota bacterium]